MQGFDAKYYEWSVYAHFFFISGWEAEDYQSIQRTLHPVRDWDSLSVESSGQLLHREAADNDTRYSNVKCLYHQTTLLCVV